MKCKHPAPTRHDTELGTVYTCEICGEDITHLLRKIQNLYIKQRTYQGQGQSYTSWVMGISNTIQTGGIIMIMWMMITGNSIEIAVWVLIVAWAFQMSFETWVGYKDYTKWKLAQRQATLSSSFTPPVVETLRILNELRDKIIPEKKTPSILDNYKKKENNQKVGGKTINQKNI